MKERKNIKSILKWIPGIAVSVFALLLIAHFVDLGKLRAAFSRFHIQEISIIVFITVISLLVRAKAWQSLLEVLDFKLSFIVINQGYFFNNLIPRSGEIVRAVLVSSEKKVSGFRVLSSIIVERAIDLAIAAGMFLVSLPMILKFEWIKPVAIALFSGVIFFLGILFLVSNNQMRVYAWLNNLMGKNKLFEKFVGPAIESLISGLSTLKNPLRFFISLFWMVLTWMLWTFLLYYALSLIIPDPPFLWAIFVESVLALGIALPSAPANIGVYEGTMIAALSIFDIDVNTALSTALVLHSLQIAVTSIIGIIGLITQGHSIHTLLEKIRIKPFSQKSED